MKVQSLWKLGQSLFLSCVNYPFVPPRGILLFLATLGGLVQPARVDRRTTPPAGWPGFLHTEPVTFTADPSAKTHHMPSPASTGQRTDNTGEGWGMKETQSHMTEGVD